MTNPNDPIEAAMIALDTSLRSQAALVLDLTILSNAVMAVLTAYENALAASRSGLNATPPEK